MLTVKAKAESGEGSAPRVRKLKQACYYSIPIAERIELLTVPFAWEDHRTRHTIPNALEALSNFLVCELTL